jgi:hypothetical protein
MIRAIDVQPAPDDLILRSSARSARAERLEG